VQVLKNLKIGETVAWIRGNKNPKFEPNPLSRPRDMPIFVRKNCCFRPFL